MGAPDLLQHLQGAGLHLQAIGDSLTVTPAALLTDELRQTIRANKAQLLAALAPPAEDAEPEPGECEPWTGQEPDPQDVAHARLLAMGLADPEAGKLAERLTLRGPDDDWISCYECANFSARRKLCGNHAQAGMPRELGSDLATLLHHCLGFHRREDLSLIEVRR